MNSYIRSRSILFIFLLGFIGGILFLRIGFVFFKPSPNTNLPQGQLVICNFENRNELKECKPVNAKLELSSEYVTEGRKSAQVYFLPSQGASAIKIEDLFEKNRKMSNWSGYQALCFDMFNPQDNRERIILQIKDRNKKREKINVYLKPNTENKIKIDLDCLRGKLDLENIIQYELFLWKNKTRKRFYLDNLRLIQQSSISQEKGSIQDARFLPKSGEEIYATGDYFKFDAAKWTKQGSADFIELPVVIKNYSFSNFAGLFLSGGIPFPQGQLNSLDNLQLVDSENNNLSFQMKLLSRWPDKSIKWALLSLQTDLFSKENKNYSLRYGSGLPKQPQDSGLRIEENPDSIMVNTGSLKFSLNRKNFYLFDNIWVDQNNDSLFADNEIICSKADLVLRHNGQNYYSHLDQDYTLTVEEKGPVRACVKAEGWFVSERGERFCQFVVRIYAFNNSNLLKVQHTFIYTGYPENTLYHVYKKRKMPKNETIDAIYLETPLNIGQASKFAFRADGKIMQGSFSETVDLFQKAHNSYTLTKNSQMINSGKKLAGWIDLSDSQKGISVGIKDFWQQYPKSFLLNKENNCIFTCIWPDKAGALDLKTAPSALGPGAFGRGSAYGLGKTHDLVFYFHQGDFEQAKIENTLEGWLSDIVVTADREWISATKVLGKVGAYDKKFFAAEEFLSRLFDWGDRQIALNQWYGMIDFGDTLSWYRKQAYDKSYSEWGWHPEGRWGWFNCEAMGTHSGALIQFLRTGRYKYFIFGKNLSRHIMDVDTCHYNKVVNDIRLRTRVPDDYSQVGSMHRHNGSHWGGRNEETSHTNVFGLLLYYYITGDARADDVLNEAGSFLLSERMTYFLRPDIAPQRNIANVLWGDVLLYELTQDERYKQAADKWADLLHQGQKDDGSWLENFNPVQKRWQGKPKVLFMRAYTLPALIEYHKLTQNKAIAESILKATDFVTKHEQYLPYFDASAYSYWLTADEQYRENIRNRLDYSVKRQQRSDDPRWDGVVLRKAYYMRVIDFLYTMPYAFEVLK